MIVGIPFLFLLMDILSWFVTRSYPAFAYVVVVNGGLMGISLWIQILLSIYQMWRVPPTFWHHRGAILERPAGDGGGPGDNEVTNKP